MKEKEHFRNALPMAALDDIPEPSAEAKEIVGIPEIPAGRRGKQQPQQSARSLCLFETNGLTKR